MHKKSIAEIDVNVVFICDYPKYKKSTNIEYQRFRYRNEGKTYKRSVEAAGSGGHLRVTAAAHAELLS